MVIHKFNNNQAGYRAELFTVGGAHPMLSFKCVRTCATVDPRIADIYNRAVKGKAHKDMTPGSSTCHSDFGVCGDYRGYLTECRCFSLRRIEHPKLRKAFEDTVIDRALSILRKKPEGSRSLDIAFFASGHLFGEVTLLFRLFARIRQEGLNPCSINIKLIDTVYTQALSQPEASDVLEAHKSINQFIREMSQTLPKGVILTGQVYAGANAYAAAVRSTQSSKHDLLVGADTTEQEEMAELNKVASAHPSDKPLVLVKVGKENEPGIPLTCDVEANGGLSACSNPLQAVTERRTSLNHTRQRRRMTDGEIALYTIGGLLLAGGIGLGIYHFATSNKRSGARPVVAQRV